ncbi:MAG: hypothetical protein ABIZ49_05260 [Opitutaceae bacterium]
MAVGVIAKLKGAIVNTTANAGTFVDAEDKSPTAANALSKGLSILGGGGSINRASGNYVFALDQKNFEDGVNAGSQLFLNHVAKSIASERK